MENEPTKEYLSSVIKQYETGHAREHSYRPALEKLFGEVTGLRIVNEPKRSEYGAPDFVFINKKIVVCYAEAKDINVSLDEIEKSEQMVRYYGYSNIILTNCLEFRFYRNGQKYCEPIKVAELKSGGISFLDSNFKLLEDTIVDFIKEAKEPIKSGAILAKVMAGKARRIRDNIKIFLKTGDAQKNESLLAIYGVIKKLLLADLDFDKFADMYAQTVVYGLFVARYHDETPDTFTRQEARDLVPKSNPFLREFFDHIAGPSFDERIGFIVNELCEEFIHADIPAIVHDYYKVEKDSSRDPIIHFYEDFLQAYDASERKKMGVFYTPLPVVKFIVRSIDEILKKDFGLKGLADSTTTEIGKVIQGKKTKLTVHKVQILDPATGTGTFLNEVIGFIKNQFGGQEGRWSSYAKNDLLPRLHGFEIMMASYTIAHLKLSTTLKESGADIDSDRLGVYLTNSLEKAEKWDDTLFASLGLEKAITEESHLANKIKNDLPIMVVLGNPPYNVSSQNKGEWIGELIKDYKNDLGETRIHIDDDYIKFIRFAQYLIEKNGEGVIGMITNNSYLDGITHRQMRKYLLEIFSDIYILDLHGNIKKKEKALDGSKDENVFSIQQGVAIALFVRKNDKKKSLGTVWHAELFGRQKDKYLALDNLDFQKMKWKKIDYKEPYYFFVPKDFVMEDEYKEGFIVKEIFNVCGPGVKTERDKISIHFDVDSVKKVVNDFCKLTVSELRIKYSLPKDSRDWSIERAKNDVLTNYDFEKYLLPINYRPFDRRWIYYPGTSKGFIGTPGKKVMSNIVNNNVGLIFARQFGSGKHFICFITKNLIEISSQPYAPYTLFPLYLYNEDGSKIPNLKKEIVTKIEKIVGKVTPENILDYIYAVLHSPTYREKYKEFLKIDFPRVPYPKDKKIFDKLVEFGKELRSLHLLESPRLQKLITTFSESGSDTVEKGYPKYKDDKVYINAKQYFGNVPEIAWNFYIGGYQPAQKWLKDRRGRKLSNADIEHYQKIILVLVETDKIIEKI